MGSVCVAIYARKVYCETIVNSKQREETLKKEKRKNSPKTIHTASTQDDTVRQV